MASFFGRAFGLGALDVFLTPVLMKKNRLATKLTVLAEIDKMEALINAVFQETSSIGVRYFPVKRRVLERTIEKLRVLDKEVSIKISSLDGKTVNVQPEFEDCLKLAKKSGRSAKEIIQLAVKEYYNKRKKKA